MWRSASFVVLLAVSRAWADGPVLPPGPGKAVVESKCKQCHSLKNITKQHQDVKWWAGTLDKMVERGLEIEPDEQDQVLKYLAKNFGAHGAAVSTTKTAKKR